MWGKTPNIRSNYFKLMKTKGDFYFKKGVGQHLIVEFYGYKEVSSVVQVKKILKEAVEKMRARLLKIAIHRFQPQGLTAIALIAESHISLHFWPEFRYLAVDIFTCGKKDPHLALEVLKEKFQPQKIKIKKITRGSSI